jgi:serine/threonine protein kinase
MSNNPVRDTGEGHNLDRLVKELGPLPVDKAVDYLIQAARALEALHAQGYVHGRITPGNLVIDRAGIVGVLDQTSPSVTDAGNTVTLSPSGDLTPNSGDSGDIDYMSPEVASHAHRPDQRTDIYSLGCTLYFLLTGRAPFAGQTPEDEDTLRSQRDENAPSLRTTRPDASRRIEACYEKLTAKCPDDRPRTMTEVIAILEASKLAPDAATGTAASTPKPRAEPIVPDETRHKIAASTRSNNEPSLRVRREESGGFSINRELNPEDLAAEATTERLQPSPRQPVSRPTPLQGSRTAAYLSRTRQRTIAFFVLGGGLLLAIIVVFALSRGPRFPSDQEPSAPVLSPGSNEKTRPVDQRPPALPVMERKTIFDGQSARGWMLCNRNPLPSRNIQHDGLNPHRSGSYLVVYEQKLGDFVLDFDYKLSKGCNSGVFVRVSDLNDPAQTGIEVSLDDTPHGDDRDSGGFHGLLAPSEFAQKPAGQWNHMTILARGPRLTVALNAKEVSAIDLDSWTLPGKRRNDSDHPIPSGAIAHMARIGYLGFQDLGGDCWFRNMIVTTPAQSTRAE